MYALALVLAIILSTVSCFCQENANLELKPDSLQEKVSIPIHQDSININEVECVFGANNHLVSYSFLPIVVSPSAENNWYENFKTFYLPTRQFSKFRDTPPTINLNLNLNPKLKVTGYYDFASNTQYNYIFTPNFHSDKHYKTKVEYRITPKLGVGLTIEKMFIGGRWANYYSLSAEEY